MKWRSRKGSRVTRGLRTACRNLQRRQATMSMVEAPISPASTRRLPGLRRVSDQQPGPSNPIPSLATTTAQVPSQPHYTNLVPEQDSPYESPDESSGDSSEIGNEETQSGGSSPLSPDLDEQGSGLTWRMFGPSGFALHVPQFR